MATQKYDITGVKRFRGCLAGSLIGDCFGEPFENAEEPQGLISKTVLTNFFQKNMKNDEGKFKILNYTDDTAMTRSIALSLLQKKGFDAEDMAEKFTSDYFRKPQPDRGYGIHVVKVFRSWRDTNFENLYQAAKDQFGGSGSYGNGGAMRISPVTLFCNRSSSQQMMDIARQSAMLTHTHRDGYNGAILQCLAIRQALNSSLDTLDSNSFIDSLIDRMDKVESSGRSASQIEETNRKPYCDKLMAMKKLLNKQDVALEQIVSILGNDVTALNSVPIAIYAFLKAQQPLDDFENDNPFLRTLYLSILFGGDTDTIASMACSIAGSFYGIDSIPEAIREKCEGIEFSLDLADRLHDVAG